MLATLLKQSWFYHGSSISNQSPAAKALLLPQNPIYWQHVHGLMWTWSPWFANPSHWILHHFLLIYFHTNLTNHCIWQWAVPMPIFWNNNSLWLQMWLRWIPRTTAHHVNDRQPYLTTIQTRQWNCHLSPPQLHPIPLAPPKHPMQPCNQKKQTQMPPPCICWW